MKLRAVVIAGFILLGLDLILLLGWLSTIGVVAHHDHGAAPEKYLTTHVLASLHFPVTIGLCLALEGFEAIEVLRKKHEHVPSHPYYLLSWLIAFIVALGTDTSSLIELYIHPFVDDYAWKIEATVAIYAITSTLLVLVWSIWLYITSRYLQSRASSRHHQS